MVLLSPAQLFIPTALHVPLQITLSNVMSTSPMSIYLLPSFPQGKIEWE